MYLNKINLFLVISICLTFFFLTYFDVKSDAVVNIANTIVTEKENSRMKETLDEIILFREKLENYMSRS